MAGLLDFLGGAAGAYAGIANENRQRSQMEEYNNRLRQQELEDWKKKEQYRQQLAREGRAGEISNIMQSPTGQVVALRYNERGTDPTLAVLGEIPGQREEYERGLLQQQMKQERDAELDAALLQQRRASAERSRRAPQGGSREPSIRDQIALEEHTFNLALEEAGITRTNQGYVRYEPGKETRFGVGEPVAVPVPATEIAAIRRRAMGGQQAEEQQPARQGLLSQATGMLGGMLRGGGGQSSPVPVASIEEAEALPSGTRFILNGRIGVKE